MYGSGRVWSASVDVVGDGDAGEICAASVAVELADGALVADTAVLPWDHNEWRCPSGIESAWTASHPGFVDCKGSAHEFRDGSAYTQRETIKKLHSRMRHVLLAAEQLEDAVSVTVDGVLTYSAENGKLVPAAGGDTSGGSMDYEFATANRPATAKTVGGMAHTQPGIRYDMEMV